MTSFRQDPVYTTIYVVCNTFFMGKNFFRNSRRLYYGVKKRGDR